MIPTKNAPRTLVIDGRASAAKDRVPSRREALRSLAANEYDTIVLHTEIPGRDDYDLVSYLAATWPTLLHQLTIRTMTPGHRSYQWNPAKACFEAVPGSPRRTRDFSRRSKAVALDLAASAR
jgi:hypothetical protein